MCSPMAISNAVSIATQATKVAVSTIEEKKNAKYNSQIALINAKKEENEAKRQIQEGIEQSREEKLKAKQKANLLNAQNASSGFDVGFGTNLYNFENINLEGENAAKSIQNQYNNNAQNHLDKANYYLQQSKNIVSKYNSSLFSKALGSTNKVSNSWYSNAYEDSISFGGN